MTHFRNGNLAEQGPHISQWPSDSVSERGAIFKRNRINDALLAFLLPLCICYLYVSSMCTVSPFFPFIEFFIEFFIYFSGSDFDLSIIRDLVKVTYPY